jgi:hypothetical protein
LAIRRSTVSKLRRGDTFKPAVDGIPHWVTVHQARPRWRGEVEVWTDNHTSMTLPGKFEIWIQR